MRNAGDVIVLAVATLLTGCAVGPNYHPPKVATADNYAGNELVTAAQAAVDPAWWHQFNDPLLNQLIDQGIAANYSIAAAGARLRSARAARRERLFDFLPKVEGSANYRNRRQSLGGAPPGTPVARDYDLYDAGFDATWELDLFGRVRRLNQSARASAEAAEASRNDVVLSVIAEIARNYFELRGAQNQLAVAERNAEVQTSALRLVNSRLDAGSGTLLDTARAQAQVETTLALVPPLEAAVSRAIYRLEVLVGKQPGQMTAQLAKQAEMPKLPEQLLIGQPAELLRRRPDIRVAERQLAASSARIGVAVGDLFPRLTLNGAIGLSANRFDALGDAGNDTRSFGPSLTWAFLDYGHIRQQIKAAGFNRDAQLADYQQTVLLALEDTEDALSDFSRERRRLAHLDLAAKASVQAADLATQRFDGGVTDFLTALDAYRTSLDAENLRAASQTKVATSLIALYKALGGGWEVAAPPDR
jgi:outer membrane protein, multidrug efflux system